MPRRPSEHVDDPVAVGRRVHEARRRAGLTQAELAFPGCTTTYISHIEAGHRTPSLQILTELGKALGVSAEYLATGQQPSNLLDDPVFEAELDLRFDDSSEAKQRLAELAEAATDARTRARALARLGHVSFEAGEHNRAIEQLELALEIRPTLDDE